MSSVTSDLHQDRPGWQAHAACNHTSVASTAKARAAIFFVSHDDGATNAAAKRICAACPVSQECLEYAIVERLVHGVWGGMSVRQRREIRAEWLRTGRIERVGGGGTQPVELRLVRS